jgi:hypothetical protein
MKVTFLKLAATELDDAFEYYESIQRGLGFRFLAQVELSQSRITSFPLSYEEIGNFSRRCLVQKFPYGLIYQYIDSEDEVLIVAVAHLHRKPDYWVEI